jgi:micrococcal nuclease
VGGAGSATSPGVTVTKVTDGDTIHLSYEGSDERVRLIGVNTPEVDWYGGEAQCYGAEAGLYARRRLSGVRIRLVFDVQRRDRYGRLLAYVYLGPELFNLTLVRLGYARADPVPPDTRFAAIFQRAQDAARQAGAGLWSACPT